MSEVLLERDFLDEIGLKNPKLIDFVCENFKEILSYIINEN